MHPTPNTPGMIVVTGATNNIGCAVIARLNEELFKDIIAVDNYSNHTGQECPEGRFISAKVSLDKLIPWLDQNHRSIQIILHAQQDNQLSEIIWKRCVQYGLPFIYYTCEDLSVESFNPKTHEHTFDRWAEIQKEKPYFWAGLRFVSSTKQEIPSVVAYFMQHRKVCGQYLLTADSIQKLYTNPSTQPIGKKTK